MRDAWPTAEDLQALLNSASVGDISPALALEGPLSLAQERLEDAGYKPFLAGAEASDRPFDPPGAVQRPYSTLMGGGLLLSLRGGAVEITQVSIDTGQGPTEYGPGTLWYPMPGSAPGNGEPYTALRFNRPIFAIPGGVTVTARWGWGDMIPEQAWNYVRYEAAFAVLPLINSSLVQAAFAKAANVSGGQIKAKESGPQRIEYATVDPLKLAEMSTIFTQWLTLRNAAYARYRLEDF